MAEEPSEKPEHLSFKEKLKRFQNKDVNPSDSMKVFMVFIFVDIKLFSLSVFS